MSETKPEQPPKRKKPTVKTINQGTTEFDFVNLRRSKAFVAVTPGNPLQTLEYSQLPLVVFMALARRADLVDEETRQRAAWVWMANIEFAQVPAIAELSAAPAKLLAEGKYLFHSMFFAYPAIAMDFPQFNIDMNQVRSQLTPRVSDRKMNTLSYDHDHAIRWSIAVSPLAENILVIDYRVKPIYSQLPSVPDSQ
jgi:hypothetical protein